MHEKSVKEINTGRPVCFAKTWTKQLLSQATLLDLVFDKESLGLFSCTESYLTPILVQITLV